jgi:hypothetical protein
VRRFPFEKESETREVVGRARLGDQPSPDRFADAGEDDRDRQDATVLRGSLPQAFTEKSEVRGVNPVLVRKKAKACGDVLYGIVLGLVLAMPGCNNTECSAAEVRNGCWPAIGSKAEQEALCGLPGHCAHSTPMGGGIGP